MEFVYDRLSKGMFISKDRKTLSNVYTGETPYSEEQVSRAFKNYRGTMGSVQIDYWKRIYYEVEYSYKVIKEKRSPSWLVFEFGLVSYNAADNAYSVTNDSSGGFAFQLRGSYGSNYLMLVAKDSKKIYKEEVFSPSSVGTEMSGKFGVFVDKTLSPNSGFILVKDSTVYKIQNVDMTYNHFGQSLCAMFGIYNSDTVQTKLHMLKARDFTHYSHFNFEK